MYILLDHKPFTQHSYIVYISIRMVLFASDLSILSANFVCAKCFIAVRCDQELSEPRMCVSVPRSV